MGEGAGDEGIIEEADLVEAGNANGRKFRRAMEQAYADAGGQEGAILGIHGPPGAQPRLMNAEGCLQESLLVRSWLS